MKISYCITCHNEDITLNNLLSFLLPIINNDELLIQDDFSNNIDTLNIIDKYKNEKNIIYYKYALNNNYGNFKNEFIKRASGNYIFAIDADELPSENIIGDNLHNIIDANPGIEAYAVPRINDFRGVTDQHVKHWGWKLTPSTSIIHEKIIDTNSDEYKFLKKNGYILKETEID